MKKGDRFFGGISDAVDLLQYKPYSNVILCIWDDKYTIPSIIGGRDNCKHPVVEKQQCRVCGAFVGNIGREQSINQAYEHIFWFVTKLHNLVDRIIIKSNFYIPTEYEHKLTKAGLPYHSVKSYHLYNKIIPMSSLQQEYNESVFLTIYQNKGMRHILNTPSLYCANLCIYDLLLEDCLIINPDYHEIQYSYSKNYLVCNSKIVDELRGNQ